MLRGTNKYQGVCIVLRNFSQVIFETFEFETFDFFLRNLMIFFWNSSKFWSASEMLINVKECWGIIDYLLKNFFPSKIPILKSILTLLTLRLIRRLRLLRTLYKKLGAWKLSALTNWNPNNATPSCVEFHLKDYKAFFEFCNKSLDTSFGK